MNIPVKVFVTAADKLPEFSKCQFNQIFYRKLTPDVRIIRNSNRNQTRNTLRNRVISRHFGIFYRKVETSLQKIIENRTFLDAYSSKYKVVERPRYHYIKVLLRSCYPLEI